MSQIANRYSWQTSALPEQLTQLTYQDSFTQAEYETIARGLISGAFQNDFAPEEHIAPNTS